MTAVVTSAETRPRPRSSPLVATTSARLALRPLRLVRATQPRDSARYSSWPPPRSSESLGGADPALRTGSWLLPTTDPATLTDTNEGGENRFPKPTGARRAGHGALTSLRWWRPAGERRAVALDGRRGERALVAPHPLRTPSQVARRQARAGQWRHRIRALALSGTVLVEGMGSPALGLAGRRWVRTVRALSGARRSLEGGRGTAAPLGVTAFVGPDCGGAVASDRRLAHHGLLSA